MAVLQTYFAGDGGLVWVVPEVERVQSQDPHSQLIAGVQHAWSTFTEAASHVLSWGKVQRIFTVTPTAFVGVSRLRRCLESREEHALVISQLLIFAYEHGGSTGSCLWAALRQGAMGAERTACRLLAEDGQEGWEPILEDVNMETLPGRTQRSQARSSSTVMLNAEHQHYLRNPAPRGAPIIREAWTAVFGITSELGHGLPSSAWVESPTTRVLLDPVLDGLALFTSTWDRGNGSLRAMLEAHERMARHADKAMEPMKDRAMRDAVSATACYTI